jgi:hypothetical protein
LNPASVAKKRDTIHAADRSPSQQNTTSPLHDACRERLTDI